MSATTPSTGRTSTYAVGGLHLRSEIELALPAVSSDDVDVEVRVDDEPVTTDAPPDGVVVASHDLGGHWWYVATDTGSGYCVRFRDCGEFRIAYELNRVVVHADHRGRPELLPVLLAGTVVAFLLTMQGRTVLHASAVAFDGAASVFIGHSGHGKSTVAALMCSRGATLLADDVLVVDSGPPPRCTGGAVELRLREPAASISTLIPDATRGTTPDGRIATSVTMADTSTVPLKCIIIPRPSRSHRDLVTQELPPSSGLFATLACPRVHGWQRNDVITRDFSTLWSITNQIPVIEAVIPWGPPFHPDVVAELAALAGAPRGK